MRFRSWRRRYALCTSNSSMTQTRIEPIQESDLPEIGRFLHANLNKRFSPEAWIQSLTHPWSESRPNFGVQMRAGDRLVGVFCAIYSDQFVAGTLEKFCNPHSWCVLEEYRGQSINLVLALVRQRGYHFSMLTPNPKVAEIFRHFKFKDLEKTIVVLPHWRWLFAWPFKCVAESDRQKIEGLLPPETRRTFVLHRDIPWLRFFAFGRGDRICLVAFKVGRWKRLRCANIIYISDAKAFRQDADILQRYLVLRLAIPISKVEARFLY